VLQRFVNELGHHLSTAYAAQSTLLELQQRMRPQLVLTHLETDADLQLAE
jgi:hypothetical protein